MSKSKRTQRYTPGTRPANSDAAGSARQTTRASAANGTKGAAISTTGGNGGVATVSAGSRSVNGTNGTAVAARQSMKSTRTMPAASTAGVRRTGGTATGGTRTARAAGSKNRRRKVAFVWWQSPWIVIGAPIVAIVLVLAIFIGIATHSSTGGSNAQPVPVAVLHGVTSVSPSTFAAVATGDVPNPFIASGNGITTGVTSGYPKVPILRDSSGKPIFLYIGAEYCPYCAAERWSMVIALSRFGTFSNLHIISSSSTDVYANTPTFTFYKSTYTSPYIDFQPVETEDRNQQPLQSMTSAQSQIFAKYNASQSFPFIDFGNQYVAVGASYSNNVLYSQNWQTIASGLNSPKSNVTQSVVGTANYITAAICQTTGNKPASVCNAAPIPALEKTIGKPAGS